MKVIKLFHFDVSERSSVDNKVRAFAKATALDLGFVTKEELNHDIARVFDRLEKLDEKLDRLLEIKWKE